MRDTGFKRRRETEVDPLELPARVRIRADGDANAGVSGDLEERDIEVLPVRVGIDLDGDVLFGCGRKDDGPVRLQARSEVVDATSRMCEHVDRGITHGGEVTVRLVFGPSEGGMEGSEHEIEMTQRVPVDVTFTGRTEVHLDRPQRQDRKAFSRELLVGARDLGGLPREAAFVETLHDAQAGRVIGDRDVFVSPLGSRSSHRVQ